MRLTRRETLLGAGALGLALPAGAAAPRRGRLSNPAASRQARALYAYLWSRYGRRTLTGQQEGFAATGGPDAELRHIERVTGKLPALLGLDYIDPRDNANVNRRAAAWIASGGIATICWHWGAPDIGTGYENSKKDFDVAAALTPGTPQHRAMHAQMAETGDLLQALRDQQLPILWRPFHEFSGDWFWWGKHGPDAFKALWRTMYDYYVHERRLDNLIWVLGWAGQNVDPHWYPGRAYVDVAGSDIYVEDHGNLAPMFAATKAIVGDSVPICLHENGPIPDPATLGPQADWLWFMTWHTRWLTDPAQNTAAQLKAYYNSARYVTKDELPRYLAG
ncbi:glycosyl hydrolase [Sphingomonas silueang]|uniref:glycosyl hydrolase n=1 Tax=Sphingomonas silueang TaxID=3156617 RepID=UPI0032B582ED